MAEIGVNMAKGIFQGISDSVGWLWGQLKKWCGDVIDYIKGVFGINSPSKVMRDTVGVGIAEGVALGVEQNADLVADAMEDLLDVDAAQQAAENLKNNILAIYSEMAEGVEDNVKEASKNIDKMAGKLKNYGSLTDAVSFSVNGETEESKQLHDIASDTKVLEQYRDALLAVKGRGDVPKEFFAILADMSVGEGLDFAKLLNGANLERFIQLLDKSLRACTQNF
jgi:phage-related protein